MSKIGVVCGSFHKDEVSRMLETVKSTIEEQGLLGAEGSLMEPVCPGPLKCPWPPSAFWMPVALVW